MTESSNTDRSAGLAATPVSRRQVLKLGAGALPCLVGSSVVYDWMRTLGTGDRVAEVDPVGAAYDASAHRWAFVVDAGACIGCGLCVVACKNENNVPLDEEHTRTWVERHAVADDGTVTVDSPEAGYRGFVAEESPAAGSTTVPVVMPATAADGQAHFVPRLCMQCENSPCTGVCPVGATYRTPDGVVLVDEQRCIGCGYCVVACPYGARYIVPAGPRTPAGVAGVADKCTFCYHRITRGGVPACVEVCPVKARKFGDLEDPTSEVATIIRERPTKVMRASLGTKPRVHYLGLDGEAV